MRYTSAFAALLLSSTSVFAADAIVYEPVAEVVVVDTFSWTGGYIGVNAGYAGNKQKSRAAFNIWGWDEVEDENGDLIDVEVLNTVNARLNQNSSGFVGGIQAGYNWQVDQMVYGIETDIQASGVKGVTDFNISTQGNNIFDGSIGNKISWFGTTRARIGYTPVDRFLVYATAGIAYGKAKSHISGSFVNNEIINESVSKTKTGWTVGAGAEYAFTDNWTLKSEYLYTDLGKLKFNGVGGQNDILDTFNGDTKLNFHTVRVGVNYKF